MVFAVVLSQFKITTPRVVPSFAKARRTTTDFSQAIKTRNSIPLVVAFQTRWPQVLNSVPATFTQSLDVIHGAFPLFQLFSTQPAEAIEFADDAIFVPNHPAHLGFGCFAYLNCRPDLHQNNFTPVFSFRR